MKRRWGVRVALWLLRRHPARFRERHGAEVEAELSRAASSGEPPARLALDAVLTLVRSWRDEMRRGWRGEGRSGLAGELAGEVRYAWRGLSRDPLQGVVTVLTLALAIGANAAVFSVAYAVLLRTLPYEAPERTVRVEPSPVRITANEGYGVSSTLRELPQVESASAFTVGGSASLTSESGAEPVRVTHVDGEFFEALGARLRLGRPPGVGGAGGPEAVLSHGLWQRAFGGDPGVVGRTVHLSDHAVTVTGVAAPEVEYPSGTEVWLSYPVLFDLMGPASSADVIARIARPELTAEVRDGHEARVRAQWAEQGEELPENRRPELIPLRDSLIGPVGDSLVVLFGASALVLLLGCVNLAGLILARNAARRGEFVMRRALGAGRLRLSRMILVESLVIAAAAAVFALALAVWGRSLLVRLLPAGLPGLEGGGPGLETLGFVALAAVAASVLVGLIPAAQLWLEAGSAPGAAGRMEERKRRLHPSLVVAQVALAVVLVVSAGLLGRSVLSLRYVPLGYDTDGVWTFEARLPWTVGGWDGLAFGRFADIVRTRLVEQPGVLEVGVTSRLPLSDGLGVSYRVWPAGTEEAAASRQATTYSVSSTYFDAFGIRMLAGPGLPAGADAAGTVVVSRALAHELWGRTDVVGEQVRARVTMRQEPGLHTIAGVVDDLRPGGFLGDAQPSIFFPFHTSPSPSMAFAVRTSRDAGDVTALVRRAVSEADPSVAPFAIRSMRSAAGQAIAERDALAMVSGLFGAAALLLATLGIYGLVAQSVVRRRREMGVRLAVGARAADVLRLVLRGTLALASLGVVVGLLASFGATRLLSDFLFGVGATDPVTFAAVAGLVLVVACGAGLGPARRAASTDPIASLRSD